MHRRSGMSDPIPSPEVPHTGERGAPPLTILATRYPSGATLSLVLLLVLGATLLFLPDLLGYGAHPLAWSDRLSGAAVVALALAAAVTARPWISWIAGAIGLWIVLVAVALTAWPRGAIAQRHGSADRLALWPSA